MLKELVYFELSGCAVASLQIISSYLTFKLSLFLFEYCFKSDRCFMKLLFGW